MSLIYFIIKIYSSFMRKNVFYYISINRFFCPKLYVANYKLLKVNFISLKTMFNMCVHACVRACAKFLWQRTFKL